MSSDTQDRSEPISSQKSLINDRNISAKTFDRMLSRGEISQEERERFVALLNHPRVMETVFTMFPEMDPRRPRTVTEDPYSVQIFEESMSNAIVNNSEFRIAVRDWHTSSQINEGERIHDAATICAKVISRLFDRNHRVHLLQGAVQLGKTSVCILSAMVLSKLLDDTLIVVYLSDSQSGNHRQNLNDWRTISQRCRTEMHVLASPDNDHTPNRQEYNDRIFNDANNYLQGQNKPELLVLSCKKNPDNMNGLCSVLKRLKETNEDGFRVFIINDEADAQTVVPDIIDPNSSYTELEKMAEMADHVLHVTATPQAVLGIPHHHLLAPCSVSVMKRPASYISPHIMWLKPENLQKHVLDWEAPQVPFQQRRVEDDLSILQENDALARESLRNLLLCHSVKAQLMRKDVDVEIAHCSALLQLTKFVKVQNRLVEILDEVRNDLLQIWNEGGEGKDELISRIDEINSRIKRQAGIHHSTDKHDYQRIIRIIEECDIRAHNGDFPEPIYSVADPENPINAIYVALDMLSRARRVVGLVTVAVWHMGKRPSVDLYRQRDRMSGHRDYCRDYITWHLPRNIVYALHGIAIAQEKQREWLENADQENIDLRSVSLPLFYHKGGVSTSRVDGLEQIDEHSLFNGGRFDRKFWQPMAIESFVHEIQNLIDVSQEMELLVNRHNKGNGNRLQIRGSGKQITDLLMMTVVRPDLGLAPDSVTSLIEEIRSSTNIDTSLSEVETTLTIQLAGSSSYPIEVPGMTNCRIALRSPSEERPTSEISGSLGGGTGENTVKDWDLDWRASSYDERILRWKNKRSPVMGMHLLLTGLRLRNDEMPAIDDPVRFALGAEVPLGLWSDSENVMIRPGGNYDE